VTIRHIVATDNKWGISREGETPWFLPNELAHMRSTMERFGGIVLVGSKTWEIMEQNARVRDPDNISFGGRRIYVVTSRDLALPSNVTLVPDLKTFEVEMRRRSQDFWVASGTLYDQIAPDVVYRTLVEADLKCDTFYAMAEQLKRTHASPVVRENNLNYSYEIWSRV
jgi:dihydrofolate reductase